MEKKGIGIVRRAVLQELAYREDALNRAKIEHARGHMSAEELADYEDDATNGRIAKEVMEHALSLYEQRTLK